MKKSKDNFLDYQMWRLEADLTIDHIRNVIIKHRKDIDMSNENVKLWNKLRYEKKDN